LRNKKFEIANNKLVSKINKGKQKYFQFNIVVSRWWEGGWVQVSAGSAVRNKIQSY